MDEIAKELRRDLMCAEHEPSDVEIFCLILFVSIVEFIFGFMVGFAVGIGH